MYNLEVGDPIKKEAKSVNQRLPRRPVAWQDGWALNGGSESRWEPMGVLLCFLRERKHKVTS